MVAPISPPVTELSLPMIAFCTVLDRVSSTIRSIELSWANSRLPARRNAITKNPYTNSGRSIFSISGKPNTNMLSHMATSSGYECFCPDLLHLIAK